MSFLQRYLDPSEILGEFLFGAIMVLTFTLGASVAGGYEKGLLLAALGCNVAWGVIDGVLLVMSNRYARRRDQRERTQPTSMPFTRADSGTLFAVFLLVVSSAIPAALPFFVIADPHQALRASNALMIVLLFVAGWRYGRHIDTRPWLAGLVLAVIGVALVAIAIALGG
ncbi:MAG TPA: hypothetical protein VNF72_10175 [Myxococcota bacterium]|jgi:VIT1/CCC1 family predicted Fe2+/Mn2+ transporter|nr:hypothetical protein [Myxococcota bacterium]